MTYLRVTVEIITGTLQWRLYVPLCSIDWIPERPTYIACFVNYEGRLENNFTWLIIL